MHLFYSENIDLDTGIVTFNKEESYHMLRTLRLKKGEEVLVTNGQGNCYSCLIEDADIKSLTAIIKQKTEVENEKLFRLHIACALTKNPSRIEFFMEKAVEIGLDEYTPIVFRRSERTVFKKDRLQKIAISAMKQSQCFILPQINDVKHFDDFLNEIGDTSLTKLMAYKSDDALHIKNKLQFQKNVVVLIGPEGDFTPEEIEKAKKNGFEIIHLGNQRLRTETAALYVCMAVQLINS